LGAKNVYQMCQKLDEEEDDGSEICIHNGVYLTAVFPLAIVQRLQQLSEWIKYRVVQVKSLCKPTSS